MCGCGPSVDTYGATLNVHDFVQCYAIEGLLVTPRVCRIYRRFTLLLLVLPQTTVFGATLNAKLRGGTVNRQWQFFYIFLDSNVQHHENSSNFDSPASEWRDWLLSERCPLGSHQVSGA